MQSCYNSDEDAHLAGRYYKREPFFVSEPNYFELEATHTFYRRSIYNPKYHLHERLAMLQGTDTYIPDVEFNEIKRELRRCRLDKSPRHARLHIQRALHRLNARYGTKYWTKKWLERWPQITTRLCDNQELFRLYSLESRIDRLFERVITGWRTVRAKFPRRKHMPHFSYMITQLMRLCGVPPELSIEWLPQLTTRDKLKQTEIYWRAICRATGWPFLTLRPHVQRYYQRYGVHTI